MNPFSTLAVRRAVAALFLGWAILAVVLSLGALRAPGDRLYHPFTHTRIATTSVIHELSPRARESAASAGRPDPVDEREALPRGAARRHRRPRSRATEHLRAREARRAPRRWSRSRRSRWPGRRRRRWCRAARAAGAGRGSISSPEARAWWLKPDRTEAWTLLLFCCTMATQLATMTQTNLIPWAGRACWSMRR